MNILRSVGDFFALDIGTTAVRAVKLKHAGGDKYSLERYGSVPISVKTSTSDAPEDRKKLSEAIMTLLGQTNIDDKNVVLGIPSGKVFATVIDIPDMPAEDLHAAIMYQSEQYIPTSPDESKIDWAVLGQTANDPTKNEVLIVSAANEFTEGRLDLVEKLGLNVIAIEPDSVAIVRALLSQDSKGIQMLINVGDSATDIIITRDGAPRLMRTLPMGIMSAAKAASQRLSVDEAQAMQFILKFGFQRDKLEGQLFNAIEGTIDQFTSEITKSISFFENKYPGMKVETTILSGYGESIPAFAEYVGNKTNLTTVAGNPWAGVSLTSAQTQSMQGSSSSYAVAVGLAKRKQTS
ncbi:MAG: type IV pilus assembly protein PilM [Candidatus Saccharimonadales bacterium]|jgi:type IV pilus assembly protein PilM